MEIRPVTIGDAEAIAEIRRQDGVREGVLGLSSERVAVTEDFLRSFGERDRGFVASSPSKTGKPSASPSCSRTGKSAARTAASSQSWSTAAASSAA